MEKPRKDDIGQQNKLPIESSKEGMRMVGQLEHTDKCTVLWQIKSLVSLGITDRGTETGR